MGILFNLRGISLHMNNFTCPCAALVGDPTEPTNSAMYIRVYCSVYTRRLEFSIKTVRGFHTLAISTSFQ